MSLEFGAKDFGLMEVTKYILQPSFFQGAACILLNMDKWKQLSQKGQDIMLNTFFNDLQPKIVDYRKDQSERYKKIYLDGKIEYINLSPDESKIFLDTISNSTWDYLAKKDPKYIPMFRELDNKVKR